MRAASRVLARVVVGGAAAGTASYFYARNKYPAFLAPIGPHAHVAAFHCRCGEVGAQIFYPAASPGGAPRPYLRDGVLQCLVEWLEFSRGIFFMLEGAAHPCSDGTTNTVTELFQRGEKLQVIIFQHGLGGTAEMYSQLCLDFASFGFVVVALEHEDGSGIFAKDAAGKIVRYRGIDDKGAVDEETKAIRKRYDRDEIISYRRPMLLQRSKATESAIHFVQALANGSANCADHGVLARVLKHADTERVFVAGHSFGACSSVVLAQLPHLQELIKGVLLLDLWPYPLTDAEVEQGLGSIPCLSIYSSHFVEDAKHDEALTKELVRRSNGEHGHVQGTVHQTFSDAAVWFPELIGRQLGSTGATPFADARQEILSWCMRSLLLPGAPSGALPPSADHAVVAIQPREQQQSE